MGIYDNKTIVNCKYMHGIVTESFWKIETRSRKNVNKIISRIFPKMKNRNLENMEKLYKDESKIN